MVAVERVSAVQQVEKRLSEYIIDGTVQIGDKLPTEKQLCEQLTVGRGTIREAMRLLQARGLVEMRAGRGAFVASKTELGEDDVADWFRANEVQIKDVIDVRAAIEPYATRLAIMRCTEEDVNHLLEIHHACEVAAKEHDVQALGRLDTELHLAIAETTRNKLFVDINNRICGALKSFRHKTFIIPNNVRNVIPAHTAIINAFLKRDPVLGEHAMALHIEAIMTDLEASKDYSGEQQ